MLSGDATASLGRIDAKQAQRVTLERGPQRILRDTRKAGAVDHAIDRQRTVECPPHAA